MFRAATTDGATRPTGNGPLVDAFRHQWREILVAAGALAMLFAFFYIGTAYLTSYGTAVVGLSRAQVLTTGLLASVVFGATITISGIWSDRVGRRRLLGISCALSVPWGLLLFPIIDGGGAMGFAIGLIGTLAIFGISYGPAGALLPEMFRTEYRYTGAGTAYNLAGVLGGATAPILAAELSVSHGSGAVGWMLAGFGLLSLVSVLLLPETRDREMHVVQD
jgi:MFS family permease